MRDKRSVDDLSIEELERILAIRRREARQVRLRHLETSGRRLATLSPIDSEDDPAVEPAQHEAAAELPPVEPPVTYDITGDVPRFEDEIEAEMTLRRPPRQSRRAPHEPRSRRRGAWDRILLAVEIVGVIGIMGVLVLGAYLVLNENSKIEALEQKSADIQRDAAAMIATPTPQPELRVRISDYVLPGGHYSPNETGGIAAFNLDELPASIRPAAMAQLMAPQAERIEQQPSSPNRIVINTDRVQVDANIYGGDDWYSLQKGVGHFAGSANPGEAANMVLTAHNDIYGEIFRYIEFLEPGDQIRIQAVDNRWYTYEVFDKEIVRPTEVRVLAQGNGPIVTLITCHPYRVDNLRMVVFGRLTQS